MITVNKSMLETANIAKARIQSLSADKKRSLLQDEYLKVIESLLLEKDLDNPFSQEASKIKAFMEEASKRWEVRKRELDEQV